jgi:hypothetical protein
MEDANSYGILHIYGVFFTLSTIMAYCLAVALHQGLRYVSVPL